jgi:hypothetical protein
MDLLYKSDWELTKKNFIAWWEHEYFGRCAISVKAPKAGVKMTPPPLPAKVEDRWLDVDYLTASNKYRMETTYYGGEAFPDWNPGFPGWDTHWAFLGCNTTLAEETGWSDPIISDGPLESHDYTKLKLDKNGKWWKLGFQLRQLEVRESKGKCIPSNFAFGGSGDTLSMLRSSEKLLYDLVDCPDYVREFDLYLMKQWIEIYEESYTITHECAEGSTCYFTLWSPGRFYSLANDFAYMISPEMFNDIFLPSIEMQMNHLDHCVYHVDGKGNFRHVDSLLELKKIQAFQILPGANQPSPLYYMDLLKKVQNAGRNLHITIPSDEVKSALDQLSARGLFIETWCKTEEDARELLKCVEKWSVDRG